MSKGGAGKVYFVLYLAVILELLIIIVERDEAEEHLIAKQKESMKIVQSILAQLQTGTGVEGLSTRPQDQIVIKDASWANNPGMDLIKEEREYLVEVGVTDVMNDLSKVLQDDHLEAAQKQERLRDFALASNVREIYYQIWHSADDKKNITDFPTDEEIGDILEKGTGVNAESHGWTLLGYQRSTFDQDWLKNAQIPLELSKTVDWFKSAKPQYNMEAPVGDFKSHWGGLDNKVQFEYDHDTTLAPGTNHFPVSLKVRSFMARFKPSGRTGIYQLHFFSRTNKILGIRRDKNSTNIEAGDDEKVNIGTVQLTVKDLRSVIKELDRTMNDGPTKDYTTKFEAGQLSGRAYRDKIDKRVIELQGSSPDLARQAKLYAYISMILSPNQSGELMQNQASMGFTVRVVKPNIPTAEPKIADLKTVVRVFDKLSKLALPFQVSPANGTTEITKKPGSASVVSGSGGVASSAGGAGAQWVNRNLEIPVNGNLAPRDEPYIFEVLQNANGRKSEVVQCSVYVYASKLTNFDEVKGALDASWGDAIEVVAQTPSGSTIKPDEFIMQFNLGGSSQTQPIRKLSVGSNDNVIVPAGTDKIGLSIAWKDPQSGEVVELFNESGEVGLKKPLILTQDLKVDPIMNNNDPEFRIRGIVVRPPQISADDKADIGDVEAQVTSSTVRDLKTNQVYKVMVIGKPKKISGQEYEVTLKLSGGKLPLNKGMVKGNVSVSISATAKSQGASSKPRQKIVPISVSN